ncbi:hypothetical protein L7F22_037530 [Adiantum nelumboides]|nr:hypothetical protein [Adiantum nelumboides]
MVEAAALLVAALLVVALSTTAVSGDKEPRRFKKHHVRYYAQLQGGAPGLAPGFLKPVNTSFSANFGAGTLFAFNLTKGVSRTSKQLGSVRGYTVETSFLGGNDSRLLEVAYIEWDDGRYAGTLQVQGLVQVAKTEVAITGGSGSFRGARGYLVVTLAKNDQPPFLTFAHDLYLF